MDIEKLLDRFGTNYAKPRKLTKKERVELRKEIGPTWDQYINTSLVIDIGDIKLTRLCQTLTNNGYITFSSCEGHGDEIPHIYFRCRRPSAVAELSHILVEESAISHFSWLIEVYQDKARMVTNFVPFYILEPRPVQKGRLLNPREDYDRLVEDFDILGFCINDHFSEK